MIIQHHHLGASGHLRGRTGLSACIFFATGKKGYRFNPLRCPETASLPFLGDVPQPASMPAGYRRGGA
jgi:hypothetical protein